MRKFAISIIMALTVMVANAQETKVYVWGSVQDGFLKTPLTEAKVRLLEADSTTVIQDSVRVNAMKNSRGEITEAQIILTLPANHTYVLHARKMAPPDGSGIFIANQPSS